MAMRLVEAPILSFGRSVCVFSLADGGKAIAKMAARQVIGKVVVTI